MCVIFKVLYLYKRQKCPQLFPTKLEAVSCPKCGEAVQSSSVFEFVLC